MKESLFLNQILSHPRSNYVLEKGINNFHSSCMKYINNHISAEELAKLEQRQKASMLQDK